MSRGRKRGAVAIVLTIVLETPFAGAAPEAASTPLRLEYAAPGNCPTEADFEASVRARTDLARFADEPGARDVQVVIRPMGVTYAGHLAITGSSGRVSDRDVEDALCTNVVDALALVTALAVDRNAQLAAPAPTPSTAPAPSPALAPTSSIAHAIPLVPLQSPDLDAPRSPPRAHALTRADADAPLRWTASTGATFVAMNIVGPGALVGGGAFGEIRAPGPGVLAPSARLTPYAAENVGVFASQRARFVVVAVRADVCPLRFGSDDLSLRACLATDAGAIRGDGIDVVHPRTAVDFWLDAQGLFRGRWEPGRGRVFVELEGGVLVPFTRTTYEYTSPYHFVVQPSAVAAAGSFSAGFRFH